VKAKQTITEAICTIEGSSLDVGQKIQALTRLFFNRKPEDKDTGRIMIAIEIQATQLALRIQAPELGFEELWKDFDSNFSSVRNVAKSAMKIGYVAGKLNVTQ